MIEVSLKDEKTIELGMSGDVVAEDYETIRPELERIFSRSGKMKFLINTEKVKHFTLGATYQDIKFDLQHFKYIGTTAIVGTQRFSDVLTKVADKFYPEKIEHFETTADAMSWLKGYPN